MSSVPHGGNMWKNIIIGILTTVVAYVIVHFIFDKKGDKEAFKKKKTATMEAWESLMIYERNFKNAGTAMVCSADLETIGKQIASEYEKIIANIANIKDEKKGEADNMVMSLIDRRIATLREKKDSTVSYYTALDAIIASSGSEEERDDRILALQNNFLRITQAMDTVDNGFTRDVNNEMKKKYKVEFKYPPPILVSADKLGGGWTLDRQNHLNLKEDHRFNLNTPTDDFNGQWRLDSLTLFLEFSDGDLYKYLFTGGSDKVILMRKLPDSSLHVLCR